MQFKKSQRLSGTCALTPEQELERIKEVSTAASDASENRGGWKGGQRAMPPKPWIKKIKTQLPRYAYKRAGIRHGSVT